MSATWIPCGDSVSAIGEAIGDAEGEATGVWARTVGPADPTTVMKAAATISNRYNARFTASSPNTAPTPATQPGGMNDHDIW